MSSPKFWIFLVVVFVLFGFALTGYLRRLKGKPWYTVVLGGTAMFGAGAVLLGATAATLLFIQHISDDSSVLPPVTGPNGRYTVQVSAMTSGGLNAYRTAVNLWTQGKHSVEIFRSKNDPGDIRLKWQGENGLEILRPAPGAGQDEPTDPTLYCSEGAYGLEIRCGTYLP